jgi:hypothetical protein
MLQLQQHLQLPLLATRRLFAELPLQAQLLEPVVHRPGDIPGASRCAPAKQHSEHMSHESCMGEVAAIPKAASSGAAAVQVYAGPVMHRRNLVQPMQPGRKATLQQQLMPSRFEWTADICWVQGLNMNNRCMTEL